MSDRSLKAAFVLSLVLGAMFLSAGCATAIDAAEQTRNHIGNSITEAAKSWEKYDADRYEEIKRTTKYREEAQKAVLEYSNGEHAEAVKVFNAAWGTCVALDRAIGAAKAGMSKDIGPAIANAYAGVSELVKVLTKLGIKIPMGVN